METAEDALVCEEASRAAADKNTRESESLSPLKERDGNQPSPKRKRKVSFPQDHSLVRSQEPHDPWKDAGDATSTEVIESYRKACCRLKTKPCEKLVKQLEACEGFQHRIDVIDLRGTKLDQKSCEALEEVFRRVRTRTLDLENTCLDDEGVISLLEMVEFYNTASRINLAYNNKVKIRGWQAIARAVKLTPCLEYLDLRHTVWTEQSIPLLGRSLRLDCHLTVLHMEATNLTGKPLFLLASSVKNNHNLKDLFLGDNRLVPSDGQCLGAMLKYNKTLRLLDLRNNSLQDMGLGHVCEGLEEQKEGGLQTLVLWNNQLTFQGLGYLGNALVYLKSLQTLNLGHNRLTNEGIHVLKDGLLLNKSLQRLGLLNTRLSSEGIIALAEVVAESKSLLRLDIRENDPYVGGLMALALSLKVNHSLVRIDLDKELKKEPGMETTQRILLADIYGYCQRNKTIAKEQEKGPDPSPSSSQNTSNDNAPPKGAAGPAPQDNVPSASGYSGPGTASGELIQLGTDAQEDLRDLERDFYPTSSRFTITRIPEDLCSSSSVSSSGEETSTSSDGMEGLLVNFGTTPIDCMYNNTNHVTERLSTLDFEPDDFEFYNDHFSVGSKESLDSMGTPVSRECEDESASSSSDGHSAHKFERELDVMLAGVTSNQKQDGVTNHATADDAFWMQQMDGLYVTPNANAAAPSGDLLS